MADPEPADHVGIEPQATGPAICARCVYWQSTPAKPGWGLCRCEPPVLLVWKGTPTFGTTSAWPECKGGDWCGHWAEKVG